jgi:hypothetical protein
MLDEGLGAAGPLLEPLVMSVSGALLVAGAGVLPIAELPVCVLVEGMLVEGLVMVLLV